MHTTTLTGEHYFSTFTDAKSHHVTVYLQKGKDETLSKLQVYVPHAETVTREHLNFFRSDGRGEYEYTELDLYLSNKGSHHEKTNAYTPQENSVSERMNHTLMEMARCLLHDAGLPDAILHAATILNLLPSRSLDANVTPEEAFTGNKLSIAHLRIFGCKAYTHIPKDKQHKLDVKTMECTYIGYTANRKAYRLYHKPTRRVYESRDITFNKGASTTPTHITIKTGTSSITTTSPPSLKEPAEQTAENGTTLPDKEDAPEQDNPSHEAPPDAVPLPATTPCRSTRARCVPITDDDTHYEVTSYGHNAPNVNTPVGVTTTTTLSQVNKAKIDKNPQTYKEAMSHPDATQWQIACAEELDIFRRMKLYEIVDKPTD
jgi:hypothetical protein